MDDAARGRVREPGGDLQHVVQRLARPAVGPRRSSSVRRFSPSTNSKAMKCSRWSSPQKKTRAMFSWSSLAAAAGLLVEAADVLGVGGHLRRQDLQGHEAIELRVAGADDRRHAADADRLDQLEVGQLPAAKNPAEQILLATGPGLGLGDDCGGIIARLNLAIHEEIRACPGRHMGRLRPGQRTIGTVRRIGPLGLLGHEACNGC